MAAVEIFWSLQIKPDYLIPGETWTDVSFLKLLSTGHIIGYLLPVAREPRTQGFKLQVKSYTEWQLTRTQSSVCPTPLIQSDEGTIVNRHSQVPGLTPIGEKLPAFPWKQATTYSIIFLHSTSVQICRPIACSIASFAATSCVYLLRSFKVEHGKLKKMLPWIGVVPARMQI